MKVLRILIGVGAVVAVVCLASVAWGAERPDDRAGALGVGATTASEQLPYDAYGTADTVEARIRLGLDARGNVLAAERPDDRAGAIGVGAAAATAQLAERPDDRAGEIGVGAIEPDAYQVPAATTGTDWTDPVVIGGLLTLAALVVIAGVYVGTHRRHGGTGTTGPGRPAVTH